MKKITMEPPTAEEIALCAYGIWEKEGRPAGRDAAHWRQAEAQLQAAFLHEKLAAAKLTSAPGTRRPKTATRSILHSLQEMPYENCARGTGIGR